MTIRKTKKMRLIEFLGEMLVVEDAVEPLWVHVKRTDYVPGTECDPYNCTVANGGKRLDEVLAIKVQTAVTYVQFKAEPEKAKRYMNRGPVHMMVPEKIAKAHDEQRLVIPEGGFRLKLSPPAGHQRSAYRLTKKARQERTARKILSRKETARRRAAGTVRVYRTSVAGVRRNFVTSVVTAACALRN